MQPNQFPSQQFTPNTNTGGGLQPNVYYEYSQPTPPPAPTYKAKTPAGLIFALVFFIIATIGLGAYLAIDKLAPSKGADIANEKSSNDITIPLSKIDTTDSEDAIKNALVGRTFIVDNAFEQAITFTSDSECDFYYYANPTSDIPSYSISVAHSKYSVNGDIISLSDGDEFQIKNDYLVKTSDKLSKNKSTVYFDSQQFATIGKNTTQALKKYLSTWGGDASYNAEKAYISSISCSTSSKHLTNADSYICNTAFTLYFNKASADKLIKKQNMQNFSNLCANYAGLKFYAGACDGANYGISTSRNLVIRFNDDGSYRITGLYTDAEEASANNSPNATQE